MHQDIFLLYCDFNICDCNIQFQLQFVTFNSTVPTPNISKYFTELETKFNAAYRCGGNVSLVCQRRIKILQGRLSGFQTETKAICAVEFNVKLRNTCKNLSKYTKLAISFP